ncbi:MAG: L-threonylcarbamoyladenylate synthase, partial [Candidatus Saccharimonadales bacterium]
GELVAFPTETVYGLGADATSRAALTRLYDAKGRPPAHPVIVHLYDVEQIDAWAAHVPDSARRLAEALWPGPLTLILPKAPHVSLQVTGGQDTVGLRIPSHPVARRLLQEFGGGIAAPSANKFGRLSPTTAADVAHDFAEEVSLTLDGGTCDVGIESTIVDCTSQRPRILRPGMITAQQIAALAGALAAAQTGVAPAAAQPTAPRVPGSLPAHYAPRTSCQLVSASELQSRLDELVASGKKVCVLSFQERQDTAPAWIVAPAEPARYAHELYRSLRQLDREGADIILVESVPPDNEWAGIADRLKRASSGSNGNG